VDIIDMNICHISSALKGGPATSISNLTRTQVGAGDQVTLVYSATRDSNLDLLDIFGGNVSFIAWNVSRDITLREDVRAYIDLVRILRKISPDVVHLHCSKAGFIGRLACAYLGLPNVYSPRGISYLRTDCSFVKRSVYFFIEWLVAAFGGDIVACSNSEFSAVSRLPTTKHIIPNGVNFDKIDEIRALSRLGADASQFCIVICGHINESKNPWLVDRLSRNSPTDWSWKWLGDGHLRSVFEGNERIDILGWHDHEDALRVIRGADVVLHASSWEGMPNVIIEAMALERPVVASDIVGNRDLVKHGETGFLVREEADYLPYLQKLAGAKELRQRFGSAAYRLAKTEYDIKTLSKTWKDVYAASLS
jgi:glycosyltransferase involved in cell wall biosynthesis